MAMQTILRWGAIAISALTLAGCPKTQPPGNDKTPPTLRWTAIKAGTNDQFKFTGSGTIHANLGDYFTVILVAEDTEGIHQIKLSASTGYSCRSGDIGQNVGPGLGAQMVQNLQPDAQGKVLTSIFLIKNANMEFQCQPGFQFTGGGTSFSGSGTNYGGQTVTGSLSIRVGS